MQLRNFIWDGESILFQTDSNGTLNRDYTYHPQLYGELVGQSRFFHHYDALGSTDRLTDASQNVAVSCAVAGAPTRRHRPSPPSWAPADRARGCNRLVSQREAARLSAYQLLEAASWPIPARILLPIPRSATMPRPDVARSVLWSAALQRRSASARRAHQSP